MAKPMDVVIVGGGLGGASLAGALARAGLRVLVLEREREFEDRVRGEWMAPWGVVELRRLGLHERFLAAGGHHVSRAINYDELLAPEQAESAAIPLSNLFSGVPGPLCMEHVTMQNEALAAAIEAGADVCRGVAAVTVTAGSAPRVAFVWEDGQHEVACRWIVGADGRTSSVRRQLGIVMEEAPIDHLIAGLLVEGADGWPADVQSLGKVGDLLYAVFPQGDGKVRLYADYAFSGGARFAGEQGAKEMLAAFNLAPVPNSSALARAQPIGPCRSYPSQDAWVDEPCVEGCVLIGDAAGFNDPILGQGLSITLRDARTVAELLNGSADWTADLFQPYVQERKERLRRLRRAAAFVTTLSARFTAEDIERRTRAFSRMGEPRMAEMLSTAFVGPEAVSDACFTPDFYADIFGTREHFLA